MPDIEDAADSVICLQVTVAERITDQQVGHPFIADWARYAITLVLLRSPTESQRAASLDSKFRTGIHDKIASNQNQEYPCVDVSTGKERPY